MKHHYEIMRIMRTKVVDSRELWEGVNSITHVQEAISYRVGDLTSISAFSLSHSQSLTLSIYSDNFSQQQLDIEKQFQNFAYGMVTISPPSSQFYFLMYLPCSSNTLIIQRLCGLGAMFGISIPGAYPTMIPTRTKISNRKMF